MSEQTPTDRIASILFEQPPSHWREILHNILLEIQSNQRHVPPQDREYLIDLRRALAPTARQEAIPNLKPKQQSDRIYKPTS